MYRTPCYRTLDAKGLHVLYELFSAFHDVAWILTDCGKPVFLESWTIM